MRTPIVSSCLVLSIATAVTSCGCDPGTPPDPSTQRRGVREEVPAFTLRAEIVEAIEGGPLIIKVILSYHGKEAITVNGFSRYEGANIVAPEQWQNTPRGGLYTSRSAEASLKLGDEWSRMFYLHHDYATIPSGRATLKASWSIIAPAPRGQVADPIANLSKTLEIDIPAATPERLEALREGLLRDLNRNGISRDEVGTIVCHIWRTKHQVLIPVALRLLDSPYGMSFYPFTPTSFIYECSDDPRKVHAEFTRRLSQQKPKRYASIFWYWKDNKKETTLSDEDFKRLLVTDDIWVRLQTFLTFPEKCDQGWRNVLYKELAGLPSAQRTARLSQILVELDDDRFEVREQATVELDRIAECVEVELCRSLEGKTSVESHRRVERVLSRLGQPPDHDGEQTIRGLESKETEEGRQVLEALAKGPPSAWRTKEAKAILDRLAKKSSAKPP